MSEVTITPILFDEGTTEEQKPIAPVVPPAAPPIPKIGMSSYLDCNPSVSPADRAGREAYARAHGKKDAQMTIQEWREFFSKY